MTGIDFYRTQKTGLQSGSYEPDCRPAALFACDFTVLSGNPADLASRHIDRSISVDQLPVRSEEAIPEYDSVTIEVMRLPIRLREVVLLYYFQDMNTNEIAETLRVSQQAVSNRLQRAKTRLREALGNVERSEQNG